MSCALRAVEDLHSVDDVMGKETDTLGGPRQGGVKVGNIVKRFAVVDDLNAPSDLQLDAVAS